MGVRFLTPFNSANSINYAIKWEQLYKHLENSIAAAFAVVDTVCHSNGEKLPLF
jgi:hypothetical protein